MTIQSEEFKKTLSNFDLAIKSKLLDFTIENGWLSINFKENIDNEGKKWNWKLLCSQQLSNYKDRKELTNRITLMLAEKIRSLNQDVNGLLIEDKTHSD